jgi:hypothetical protein
LKTIFFLLLFADIIISANNNKKVFLIGIIMRKVFFTIFSFLLVLVACGKNTKNVDDSQENTPNNPKELSEQNLTRAIQLVDNAVSNYFTGDGMAMARYFNPYTGQRSDEKGSIWMYTSSIEAVNAILNALKTEKDHGETKLYDLYFDKYTELLSKLYENAAYYKGTFTLTSYTQTKQWSVYGVNRGGAEGMAQVDGINNVYDDQEWLIRELINAYKITMDEKYLKEAENLVKYVLDGWDCTLDNNGNEYGGITWGPGYVTKHSCSNGPIVSPLVWLYEIYKDKNDQISFIYIDIDKSRKTSSMKKSDYYLKYAEAAYLWQKSNLFRSDGVYDDMMGGCDPNCDVAYETINNVTYRKHVNLRDRVGPAISYNSGTMLSGGSDLYRVTGNSTYLQDVENLTKASFSYFAKKDVSGYYNYDVTGFNDWYNDVLMRGYVDAFTYYKNDSTCINSFQQNLDYGFKKYLYKGFLPTNLLLGWSIDNSKNNIEGMFTFSFAAEYALLSKYELEK